MSSVPYRDGLGTARYRDTHSGDGTEGSPDVMTSHDPIIATAIGTVSTTAAANPSASAGAIASLKGLWQDFLDNYPDTTDSYTLLTAVTATGAGSSQATTRYSTFTFYFVASSVTTGGTVTIEAEAPDSSWHPVYSQAIAADTATTAIAPYTVSGSFRAIRGNVTARTDGTYTLMVTARG